jgi:hypothetical protein
MLGCLVDVFSFIAIVACSFLVAHYTLPKLRLFRFSLSTLFIAVLVVSALACILRFELDLMTRTVALLSSAPDVYYPITLYSWWIFVSVLYGVMFQLNCDPIRIEWSSDWPSIKHGG